MISVTSSRLNPLTSNRTYPAVGTHQTVATSALLFVSFLEYADDEDAIFVSEAEYSAKKAQIDEMVQKVLVLEQRLRQFEENPSSNEELQSVKMQLEKLNATLETLGNFLDTLRVKNDEPAARVKEETVETEEIEQPRWSNLYSGLNRHRHKGKHTSAEFYQHKTNIINSLKVKYNL